jgi:hypothetical protein
MFAKRIKTKIRVETLTLTLIFQDIEATKKNPMITYICADKL